MNAWFLSFALILGMAVPFSNTRAASSSVLPGPPQTVEQVEFERYAGRWHEIARIPNSFEDNRTRKGFGPCHHTMAEYAQRADSKISVTNTCVRQKEDKSRESFSEVARAVAFAVPHSGGSRLKVNITGLAFLRWLGIGNGDYWILGLGPVNKQGLYCWALVGAPTRKYGWILARDPLLAPEVLEEIWTLAEWQGYRRDQFVMQVGF